MDVLYFSFGHLPLCWRSLLLKTLSVELRNGGIFCCQVSSKSTVCPSRCESTNAKKVSSLKLQKTAWRYTMFPPFPSPQIEATSLSQPNRSRLFFNSPVPRCNGHFADLHHGTQSLRLDPFCHLGVDRCLGIGKRVGNLQGTDISHHGKNEKMIQKCLGGNYFGSPGM